MIAVQVNPTTVAFVVQQSQGPAGSSTPAAFGSVVQETGNGTKAIAQATGRVLAVVSAMTGAMIIQAPAAPATGMSIMVKVKDLTFSNVNTIQFSGNGKHVEYEGANDAGGANLSPAFNPGTFGTGGAIEWAYDGVLWVST